MIIYPEAENCVGDLEMMKTQLRNTIHHLKNAQVCLYYGGDYDRYMSHIDTLIDLLEHEDSVLDYFMEKKKNE